MDEERTATLPPTPEAQDCPGPDGALVFSTYRQLESALRRTRGGEGVLTASAGSYTRCCRGRLRRSCLTSSPPPRGSDTSIPWEHTVVAPVLKQIHKQTTHTSSGTTCNASEEYRQLLTTSKGMQGQKRTTFNRSYFSYVINVLIFSSLIFIMATSQIHIKK